MEIVSYLFKNGVLKEETPIGKCPGKGHSGCMNVTKKYPCGCVEYLKHHFIYVCRYCGSNAKSLVIQKRKILCQEHRNHKLSDIHKAHISEAMRRLYAKD